MTTMTTPPVLRTLTIPGEAVKVQEVRRWLVGMLDGDHATIRDDLVVLVSELVTNAINHSDSGRGGTVTINALDLGAAVRIEVIDAGSATNTPRMLDDDSDALNGRGLRMLNVLSSGRWGTHTDDAGRTVWFEVPVTERGSPEHSGGSP